MKNKDSFPHRGRFQAQGNGLQESTPWNQSDPLTKTEAKVLLKRLSDNLTPKDLAIRQDCFDKANTIVSRAPSYGVDAQYIKSFTPKKPIKDIRVDIEVRKGNAFKD